METSWMVLDVIDVGDYVEAARPENREWGYRGC